MDEHQTPEEILAGLRKTWDEAGRNLTTAVFDRITSGSLTTSDHPVIAFAITSWRAYNDARREMEQSKRVASASSESQPDFEEAARLGVQLRPDGSLEGFRA